MQSSHLKGVSSGKTLCMPGFTIYRTVCLHLAQEKTWLKLYVCGWETSLGINAVICHGGVDLARDRGMPGGVCVCVYVCVCVCVLGEEMQFVWS